MIPPTHPETNKTKYTTPFSFLRKRRPPSVVISSEFASRDRLKVSYNSHVVVTSDSGVPRNKRVKVQRLQPVKHETKQLKANYSFVRRKLEVEISKSVTVDIQLDRLAQRLPEASFGPFCDQLSLAVSDVRSLLEAIDSLTKVLTYTQAVPFQSLPVSLKNSYKKSSAFLGNLNKTLTFGATHSLLKEKFVFPAMDDAKNPTGADNLTDSTLESVLELSVRDNISVCNFGHQTDAERFKELRSAPHVSRIKCRFTPDGQFTRDLYNTLISLIKQTKQHTSTEKTPSLTTVHHSGNYANFFQRKGKIWQFLEYNGLFDSINIQTTKEIDAMATTVPTVDSKLKAVFTSVAFLVRHGCISLREAKKAVMMGWSVLSAQLHLPSALGRLKYLRHAYNQSQTAISATSDVLCFDETLLVSSTSEFNFYLSRTVTNYINRGHFDAVFIDGTYLKGYHNAQLLILRFYSSKTKEMLNCGYVLCSKRNIESYQNILSIAGSFGLFKKLAVIISDFEMALTVSFQTIFPHVEHRFCLFHLVSATRQYAGKINKSIERLRYKIPKVTFRLSLMASYLLLANESASSVFLVFCDLLVRLQGLSIADYIFMKYFQSIYLERYKVRIGNLEKFPFVTNNSLEGTNSGLKKYIFGRENLAGAREWIAFNVKRTVLAFGSEKTLHVNELLLNIQKAFVDGDWFSAVLNKAFNVKPQRKTNVPDFEATLELLGQVSDVQLGRNRYSFFLNGVKHSLPIPTSLPPMPLDTKRLRPTLSATGRERLRNNTEPRQPVANTTSINELRFKKIKQLIN